MNDLMRQIMAGGVLISDGATGTYLQSHGLPAGGCPELFNASHPQIIRQMAADYFTAGSDMVETNSFGGNRCALAKYNLDSRVSELNKLAAEHARSAAPPGQWVLGSMGPTGEFLEPMGSASEQQLLDVFAEQAAALASGGVDALCIETMSDLAETAVAIRAARQATRLPVIATMTFARNPRGLFTMMGVAPEQCAQRLAEAGADVVGSNCGVPIDDMVEIITAMRAVTDKPLLTHVNAGTPRVEQDRTIYPGSPDYMAERATTLVDRGANIIGGCCGTGPEHIRAFVAALRTRHSRAQTL